MTVTKSSGMILSQDNSTFAKVYQVGAMNQNIWSQNSHC